ncbi:MAG: 4-(cytidine 5'-diphospho)-2-C-methyl-D-erythritol kinase [Bacilli bacterium]|jgi:4-diphosphocytidyl-2C-methyl-D-erythritol kinase|nr:4-(cytidine 5'-diphospho)-2-C-methyl-D-erythritol kinase [Bacilli bacterium]
MIIRSYAKINISLNVLSKRDDGMHEIDTVMLPLEFHDSLEISELKIIRDNFVTLSDYTVGDYGHNLATTALTKILDHAGKSNKFRIIINKNIFVSSGLGGGSSNAATTMNAIRRILKLDISKQEMKKLAFEVGSDVPFFLANVPARVRGTGEIVEPIEVKNNYYVLLVKPEIGLSTRTVYEKSDEYVLETTDIDGVIAALKKGDDETLVKLMKNSLEKPAIELLPEIQDIKDQLKEMGLEIVLMSGSGSAVFAMHKDKKVLQKAYKILRKKYEVELTKVYKGENK